jgi:zinc/manganese transport system permease protein
VTGIWTFVFGPFAGFGFMRMALAACIALAMASGPIGILLLLRRMSLDGDVLSHAVMPGAALGFLYAGYSLTALSAGGLLTGLVVAFLTRVVVRILPPTMLIVATIYRPLSVGAFDPAFLRAVDGRVVFEAVFLVLVVLTLVASFQAFGTLLAIGPLLLPATAARCWTQRVGPGIALAIAFGVIADFAGLLMSYYGNLPSGPAIVIAAGTMYAVSLVCSGLIQWAERPAWR